VERLLDRPAGELLGNKITFVDDQGRFPILYRRGEDGVEALAVEAHGPGGYGGDIVVMTGIDVESDELTGLEIIQHSETPGVGSRVEGEDFRRQWRGLSTEKPLELDDIDALTGATYSSKAVVAGTNAVLDLYRQHRDEILAAIEEDK
jgi:electron transport complex protein RnfG